MYAEREKELLAEGFTPDVIIIPPAIIQPTTSIPSSSQRRSLGLPQRRETHLQLQEYRQALDQRRSPWRQDSTINDSTISLEHYMQLLEKQLKQRSLEIQLEEGNSKGNKAAPPWIQPFPQFYQSEPRPVSNTKQRKRNKIEGGAGGTNQVRSLCANAFDSRIKGLFGALDFRWVLFEAI